MADFYDDWPTIGIRKRLRRGSDGVYRWFLIRAVPVRDKHEKIVKWCGVATGHRRPQTCMNKLRQALLISVGLVTFAMGELRRINFPHELAQPIMASTVNAKASLRWLQHAPPNLTKVREGTEKIIEAGTFASEIIARLRFVHELLS